MQQSIDAAKLTLGLIASSTASIIGASTSAVALAEQFNQTHDFLYLSLPIWVFFCAVLILSIIGSMASLFTDIYKGNNQKLPFLQQILHLIGGFLSGIIGAFVLLPALTSTAQPPIEVMLITALVLSFSGVVLINNFGEIKRDKELQKAVRKILISRISWLADLLSGSKNDRG